MFTTVGKRTATVRLRVVSRGGSLPAAVPGTSAFRSRVPQACDSSLVTVIGYETGPTRFECSDVVAGNFPVPRAPMAASLWFSSPPGAVATHLR